MLNYAKLLENIPFFNNPAELTDLETCFMWAQIRSWLLCLENNMDNRKTVLRKYSVACSDATAAELICSSILGACCLRFQVQSHFYTHTMKTFIISTKQPKCGRQNPSWPVTQEQEAFMTSPLTIQCNP